MYVPSVCYWALLHTLQVVFRALCFAESVGCTGLLFVSFAHALLPPTHTHNTHTHTQDWKDLAVLRGFGEYTQIFELKSHPVRYLLKKWGESPKWSIKALIAALECIDRMDVVHFIRSRFIQGR